VVVDMSAGSSEAEEELEVAWSLEEELEAEEELEVARPSELKAEEELEVCQHPDF
jgi:hypothetical protein